jgi:hypothetical protein
MEATRQGEGMEAVVAERRERRKRDRETDEGWRAAVGFSCRELSAMLFSGWFAKR